MSPGRGTTGGHPSPIGPAGGGKTTLLRSLNRMSDFDLRFRCQGDALFHGIDLYRQPVDVAMLFLMLLSTLAVAMYELSTLNTQSSYNLSDLQRARATAESGMRWFSYRLQHMQRPKTKVGNITSAVAANL